MTGTNPYASLATEAVGALSPYEPGMPPEALERKYGVSNAIKLASNENPFGVSESVQQAMRSALKQVTRYPDGAGFALRAALAEHYGVAAEQLTLGNGSNDILVMLAETFLDSTTTAVYDQYSFVVYRLAVQATGARALVAAANSVDHAQPLGHDLAAMLELIDATTRMVFIANPNNPTGTWLDAEPLQDFLRALPRRVIAVIDEAYFEYAVNSQPASAAPDDYPDTLAWLGEFPNLVVVRTFSKAYGLAALRVGYCVSAPGIAELLNRIRQPFNVNSVAQAAAIAALGDQEWIQNCKRRNQAGLEYLQAELASLGYGSLPSKGNFLLVKIGDDAAECHDYLLRNGVIVRPVSNYGLPEYLRITAGSEDELNQLISNLKSYAGQKHGK